MIENVGHRTISTSVKPDTAAAPVKFSRRTSALKGLLWAEWFAHSRLLLIFLSLWLVTVWLLPLFAHPGWILVLGAFYALLAGPAYGGGDVIDGCEEFTLALPATRSERYLARLAVGGGTLLFLSGINLLALGIDLPQILTRLYIEAGIIKPRPIFKTGLLYGLVLALPIAAFAFAFALASATHSRLMVLSSWFWASIAALVLLQLGFWYEELVWESFTGYFAFPLLLASAMAVLWGGHVIYRRKETGEASVPITLPGKWWLWIILFVLGVCLAMAVLSSLARNYPKFFSGTP